MNNFEDISFFIPCRAGSQRVVNKNTTDFAGIEGGLFKHKMDQLLSLELDTPIIVSTDDDKVIKIAESYEDSRIRINRRSAELSLATTRVEDLIMYVPKIVRTKHVFWLHVTTPLVSSEVYKSALELYYKKIEQGYDSLMSVTKYQSFLWDDIKKDIINFDRSKIKYPQTQDLRPLYEINHAFYIMSIDNYYKYNDRIGKNPYLFELNKIQAIDVDWKEDFDIAEILYKTKKNDK